MDVHNGLVEVVQDRDIPESDAGDVDLYAVLQKQDSYFARVSQYRHR